MRKADQLVLVPCQSGTIFEWSGYELYELSCWILLVKPSGSNILPDIFVKFLSLEEKKSFYSIRSLLSAQNGQILSQLLSGPSMKFGATL
jgi:hypothetical protein